MNRASGAPKGNNAPGTYKGGSISQPQHVAAREASSQGQPIHWLDVYVVTRDGLPEAVQIVPMPHTAADCVRAICRDRDLLRTLRVHLQSLDLDELVDVVATAEQQETGDESRLDDNA
ncbi:hypothetical protein MRB53_002271 [Persea americana]|uniref:Uncharacterized protein n=1 Tax=Persea americana TaxID=3435 RepID=A0ACC2MUR2_PERAE|nr:hypothetical protein MRB53_002271 [Persea americana]